MARASRFAKLTSRLNSPLRKKFMFTKNVREVATSRQMPYRYVGTKMPYPRRLKSVTTQSDAARPRTVQAGWGREKYLQMIGSLMEFNNLNFWAVLDNIFAKHGPAVPAIAQSYSPADFSAHFFLQLAMIMLVCRVVGWVGS